MNLLSVVRLCLVLGKLPFHLLRVLGLNIANMMAPEITFKMVQRMMKKKMPELEMTDKFESTKDLGFLFSLDQVQVQTTGEIRDILKAAQVGSPAPNPTLLNLSDKSHTSILSLATPGRPLVLNFGSCT